MITNRACWSSSLLVCVAAVATGLFLGCEMFKPKPPPAPDVSPPDADEGVSGISGTWEIEFKTNGTEFAVVPGGIGMTVIQTDDDVEGNWTLGEVDGEVEEDGDVELTLRSTFAPIVFNLEGEIEDDGEEMSGDWTSSFPPPKHEGTWKAERE